MSQSNDGSFQGKWEAKKARAMARRQEQQMQKAESSSSFFPPSSSGESSNIWAKQNQGNVLTERPSSRVINPPGGRSSISFGSSGLVSESPPRQYRPDQRADQQRASLDRARQHMDARIDTETMQRQRVRQALGKPGISSNIWANQNQGNFLTDRPTSRIINPPGGRSSLTLG